MADTVRSRLLASDLGVLPVTTYASELGRFEVLSIRLRPYARNFELELRTCLEPRGDGSSRIESTSVFEFSPTGALDHRLDRIELVPEAKRQFELALQFIGVHPYMPWGIYHLVSAMFPGTSMFPYESRLTLVDDHPTTNYDDLDSTSDASPPTTLRILPQHASWLHQTVRSGDRSARLEHVELGLDDTKYHFACSIRITGPDEDRRLVSAHRAASTGAAPPYPAPHAAIAASPPRAFTKGDKVSHKTFGVGTVVVVEKTGADGRLEIEFSSGTKVLASRFVEPVRHR